MNKLQKLFAFLKRLWNKESSGEPIETTPFPQEWQPDENIVMTVRKNQDYSPSHEIIKRIQQAKIREVNQTRRTKFSNAEHFKLRQPTTARMLWKPNAKSEEEN